MSDATTPETDRVLQLRLRAGDAEDPKFTAWLRGELLTKYNIDLVVEGNVVAYRVGDNYYDPAEVVIVRNFVLDQDVEPTTLTPREEFEAKFGSIIDDDWQWLKEFLVRNYVPRSGEESEERRNPTVVDNEGKPIVPGGGVERPQARGDSAN